ncbi:phosphotransferase family protein [Terrabacter sp. BE26]|uniref:phosphotransferase family protein n=1 Tax=Terrabacter sp. BE26 TaxID=2898152 RepID=UPI0035BE4C8C
MTGTTATTTAGPRSPHVDARDVLAGRSSPEDVCRFLTEVVPVTVATALAPLLPEAARQVRAVVTRTTLRLGRKLTVGVELSGEAIGTRHAVLTWQPGSAPEKVPASLLSRVTPSLRSPFSTLVPPPGPGGVTVRLAPVDPAFPHLVDVYDPARIASLLRRARVPGFEDEARVTALRYRPGQRHVLLLEGVDRQHRVFAKCYRDDSGRRALAASQALAQSLSITSAPAGTARAAGYIRSHRLVLWAGHDGTPLSRVLCAQSLGTGERQAHLRRAGAALRAIHDGGVHRGAVRDGAVRDGAHHPWGSLSSGRSDPAAEAAATRRATEHVRALAPEAGARLDALLGEAVAGLETLPTESGHLLHGDYKGDNLLVDGERLVLLDFDRVSVGDPAADLGKLLADLRWWAQVAGHRSAPLVDAALDGYGPCPPARVARALHYCTVFHLRAVGRRIPLHRPGWVEAVEACLETARAAAREAACERAGEASRGESRETESGLRGSSR